MMTPLEGLTLSEKLIQRIELINIIGPYIL